LFVTNVQPLPACNFLSLKHQTGLQLFKFTETFSLSYALIHQKIISGSGCCVSVGWGYLSAESGLMVKRALDNNLSTIALAFGMKFYMCPLQSEPPIYFCKMP